MRRAACKAANPLKIRASLGLSIPASFKITLRSQSLKDQGKSRTWHPLFGLCLQSRNPLKIRASLELLDFHYVEGGTSLSQSLKDQGKSRTKIIAHVQARMEESQSLKDQGKSRTAYHQADNNARRGRNPLKIRASLELRLFATKTPTVWSQSLKDQGKSRTIPRLSHKGSRLPVAIP